MPEQKEYLDLDGLARFNNHLKAKYDNISTTTEQTTALMSVPASAKGLATLKRIGGMSYKCSNLTDNSIYNNQKLACYGYFDGTNINASDGTVYWFDTKLVANQNYTLSAMLKIGSVGATAIYVLEYEDNTYAQGYFASPLQSTYTFTIAGITPAKNVKRFFIGLYSYGNYVAVDTSTIMLNTGTTALPYEAYYEGIRNSAVTKLLEIGTNRWDEEWELGGIDNTTGVTYSSSTRIRSKNFIKCLGSEDCYFKKTSGSNDLYLYFYDTEKNFISYSNRVWDTTITTSSNASYFKFVKPDTTYNHDICINVSNAEINGNYYPYSKHELAIPSEVRALDGYGWGVSDSCYNYVDFTLKQYCKYVGRVDLGSLPFYMDNSGFFYTYPALGNIKPSTSNLLCSLYKAVSQQSLANLNNMEMSIDSGGILQIRNDTYTSANDFKTAMSGVYLYYELATPTTTDISAYLTEQHLPIEPLGTLEPVNTYGNAVPVIVSFDNGLGAMVKTNHEHDIEQQREIDSLKVDKADTDDLNNYYTKSQADDKFKTKGGYHNYLKLIDTSTGNPLFVLYKELDQNIFTSQDWDAITKTDALSSLALMGETYSSADYVVVDSKFRDYIQIDKTGNTDLFEVVYQGLIGVKYDASNSGSELTICFLDDTKNTSIDVSTIGNDNTASYYFEAYSRQD